ncbi:MAG TPA: ankyrin repeat domain-containing protein [Pseudonocardiaceae bacterium]|nr:ankyrin repeat domain-containing protein [Pseudonocardiaceae bacterium]
MSTIPLPEQPDLGQLRRQARELQRSLRATDPTVQLSTAQTAIARRYGFASWARLRRHVDVITERTWVPRPAGSTESPADEFLRLACLNFDNDDPMRRAEAVRLLADHPELPETDIAVAAACADVDAVRRLLAATPSAAVTRCGPYQWSPLLYQAYARHDPDIGRDATLRAARLLLDAGADPNDGRFFLGLPTPFTVLTGIFAADWTGQPAHPHAIPFASALLRAGADPNDGQTLYNRMFGTNDDHLALLFEHGLGRGSGGPWHRMLGDQLESPRVMLASLLDWAVSHDQRDRVALLAANGVDVTSPITAPRRSTTAESTPIEVALVNGNHDLADQLRGYGATEPHPGRLDRFVAAVLAADHDAVAALPAGVATAARTARPGLIVWAAGQGRIGSVNLLVEAGFDVNAYGRADTPVEGNWLTALHAAAEHGDLAMAERLLALGADPGLRDKHHDDTPLDRARHFGHRPLVDLLAADG